MVGHLDPVILLVTDIDESQGVRADAPRVVELTVLTSLSHVFILPVFQPGIPDCRKF